MSDHRGVDFTVVTSYVVSVNWASTVSIIVGILAGAYYVTRLYKEWFGGNEQG